MSRGEIDERAPSLDANLTWNGLLLAPSYHPLDSCVRRNACPWRPGRPGDGGRVTKGHVHGEQSRCDCWLAPKGTSIGEQDAADQETSRGDCCRIRGAARANDTLDSCVRRNDGGGRSRNQPGGLLQDPWCGPGQRHPGFLRSQECMPLAPRATRGRQGDGMPAPGFDQGTAGGDQGNNACTSHSAQDPS